MAKIIDGKAIAQKVRNEIREETEKLIAKGITPGLAVIIVGEDSASQVYVRNKIKGCAEVGFYSEKHRSPFGICAVTYRFRLKGQIKL